MNSGVAGMNSGGGGSGSGSGGGGRVAAGGAVIEGRTNAGVICPSPFRGGASTAAGVAGFEIGPTRRGVAGMRGQTLARANGLSFGSLVMETSVARGALAGEASTEW